eukprot:10621878-Ditylum_brightwellii.AAC.1
MSFESIKSPNPGPTGYNIPLPPPSGWKINMEKWWDKPAKTCWVVWLSLQQICDIMHMVQLKREEGKHGRRDIVIAQVWQEKEEAL